MATPQQKAFCMQNAVFPGGGGPKHFSAPITNKQTLRVFLIIVVYRVILGSLVASLQTCESVTLFFNYPV
jgi:hypothetical protein